MVRVDNLLYACIEMLWRFFLITMLGNSDADLCYFRLFSVMVSVIVKMWLF